MKATVLYRIGSALLIVIAAGNTYSLLRFWKVVQPMNPLYFPLGHTGITYTQVVAGYEIFCSACVLFGAYLAWHLSNLAKTSPNAIGALSWMLFVYQLGGIYVSFMFLSGVVRILMVGIAVCIGCASWLVTTQSQGRLKRSEPLPG